jgi:hypothetical protein
MSRALSNVQRGKGRNDGPDGGSFPKDSGKLSVTKNSGRERTRKGVYESQSQLNRDQKSSIIKYE